MGIGQFYEMQNFAVNVITKVNIKLKSPIVYDIWIPEYMENIDKKAILHYIVAWRYKPDMRKDMLWVMNERYFQYNFTDEFDSETNVIGLFAEKKV